MKSLRALLAFVALVGAAHLPAPAADRTIVLKFSLAAHPESPRGRAAERFKYLAEERTHGQVRVDVFAGSTLYAADDELEALQLGAVQMAVVSLRNLSTLGLRDFDALELPYLFDSYEALHRVTEGPVGELLLAKLKKVGIQGLGFWDIGFKQLTTNRPVHGPEDARGLLIRTTYSRISDLEGRALGASPHPVAFADLREALATGTVDSTELTAHLVNAYRLDDVQRYITLSNHGYLGSALVVNRRFWERLPANIRKSLEDAAREATAFANDASRREEADALRALAARGRIRVIPLGEGERLRWKRALAPVYRKSEALIPADTLSSISQAAGLKSE